VFRRKVSLRAKEFAKLPYTEVRVLDKEHDSPVAINIFGNKVAMIIGLREEPVGILIKNNQIARDFKDYFDILWKEAKIISPKQVFTAEWVRRKMSVWL
jgi:hypothetical protein